ncbi:MAG: hypothetical protein AAB967_01680 [Patescibacteria group bacterium]
MTDLAPQPHNRILNILLMVSGTALVAGAVWLAVLYNQNVNAAHAISGFKEEIQNSKTETAEVKERIFALFRTENLEQLAEERSLVKEKNPQYLRTAPQWASASR